MTIDSQRSLARLTIENLKLRRLEDEGETYESTQPEVILEENIDSDMETQDPSNLNLRSSDQNLHSREVDKSALTFWRHDKENHVDEGAYTNQDKKKIYEQYRNLDTPGMGLELECLSSFLGSANKNRIIKNYLTGEQHSNLSNTKGKSE